MPAGSHGGTTAVPRRRRDGGENGTYRVDLAFRAIVARTAGTRVFSLTIEVTTVIASLDVLAAVGRITAIVVPPRQP